MTVTEETPDEACVTEGLTADGLTADGLTEISPGITETATRTNALSRVEPSMMTRAIALIR
ncbi:hypothetical protein GCM10010256_39580 [Streptomyces coeruleorubidus]|nr:hypothetical protein GCM10010256_39580 [Streptomyces coeruleorubidus]